MAEKFKPIVLAVLDGWGLSSNMQGNAITQANTPFFDELDRFYPNGALQASGISAGLPWNEMGNSEVGHLILGAGQVIYQNLPRISLAIQNGSFFTNQVLLEAIKHAKKEKSILHIIGLISSAGVHSNLDHLYALMDLIKAQELPRLCIHAFTDGRDSNPKEGITFLKKIQERIESLGIGKIASIVGRYYAMDRNNNWDRTQIAYELLTEGKAEIIEKDPITAIEKAYQRGETDEFLKPITIADSPKKISVISNNDSIVFFNFREDRARQLTKAFVLKDLKEIKRNKVLKNLYFVSMTEYEKKLPTEIAFPQKEITLPLAKILSDNGLTQLHIAETEKYAHATYFFNGGTEKPYKNEDRILIPSPTVPNYIKTPEMSALKITEELEKVIGKNKYDFIIVNYANPDMIGHTGSIEATIKAVEYIDKCISRLTKTVLAQGGAIVITADHGNAEEMLNLQTGVKMTEHSTNPVPVWIITPTNKLAKEKNQEQLLRSKNTIDGLLADIAPTILELFDIPKPTEMTGHSLLDVIK